ncbi:MAG TPA: tetratricopeptide repeat protein [Burkholderiaceae bacterium]|nr:tetratricopeptide repeat protein [Burkholderiaceae bacterium]
MLVAAAFNDQGQHDKALPLLKRAWAIRKKTLGPYDPYTQASQISLAATYSALGQYHKALPLDQEAVNIAEKAFGPNHLITAGSLSILAKTHKNLAQHKNALQLELRALALYEKALGLDHPDTALSLNRLAQIYGVLGQYDKALPLELRALAIREKALGPDHLDTAQSLSSLAFTYNALAQFDKALQLEQRVLEIREKVLGPDHLETAHSLNNLAFIFDDLAHHEKALELQLRALAIREKALEPDHPDILQSLNNLASIYSALAQHNKALPLQQRALAIYEKVLGPDHPSTATSLNNLALTYSALAQYANALPLHQRALAILEKALGPDHPDTARSLSNLAYTYRALAQQDKALPLQQRALAIWEKALGPDHPDTALSLNNLATTYDDLSQTAEGLPLKLRALSIFEIALGPEHPRTALSKSNLAYTLEVTGQPALAVAFLKASVNAYQSQRERVGRIDAAALQSYTDSVAPTYQALARLLVDQGLFPDAQLVLDMLKEQEQFEFIRRSSTADPRKTRIGYNSHEQQWMTRYRQIADRLAALGAEEQALQKQAKQGLTPEQQKRQQSLAADLRVAQTAFEAFLKEMQENFARQGPAKAEEARSTSQEALRELQTLLRSMGPDAVLLQYYVTDNQVGMLLTTPGVQLARSTQVSAKELNRQIAQYRQLLRDPKSDVLAASQALYQLLLAPVAQDLEQAGAKTVMLSLDGPLRYLPYASLHDGHQFAVQRWNLPMYTSVTRNRLRDATTPQWQAAGLGVTRALGEFAALPAVKAEMRSIIKTSAGGVLPGEVHLDGDFTAQRLKDVSQRPFQLLHVASHFRFSPGTEVNSFLLLGDGNHLTLGDIRTQNYRFDNVDLLTLSACDTGLGGGRDAQGREIEGFGVIAQQQGAKAVLATLWAVADDSTSVLMADMYRQRQQSGLSKIAALQQAQRVMLNSTRHAHPFYWAPFILMGNWK